MKIGDKVNVYQKPFSLEEFEGVGVIKTAPKPTGNHDIKGRPMFHSEIEFADEGTEYYRVFSEPPK